MGQHYGLQMGSLVGPNETGLLKASQENIDPVRWPQVKVEADKSNCKL